MKKHIIIRIGNILIFPIALILPLPVTAAVFR